MNLPLTKKNILLGVTGGIAAYKSAELVRGLIKKNAVVRVAMTESAARFVTPLTFEVLSQNRVYMDMWEGDPKEIDHVTVAGESDVFIIAPATANTIGKISHGLADNLLTNLFLAFKGPVMICPSMNSNMYLNPAVQENLQILRERNTHLMEPDFGELACGDEGIGRMPDPDNIIQALECLLKKTGELSGKKVMITAGPTREFSDPVRFLSNPSSGKMGYALAEAAVARGAEVTLISGPSQLPKPAGSQVIHTVSADEMNHAVIDHIEGMDIAIMAAAVSDYKPASCQHEKIKKNREKLSMDLELTPDILDGLGKRNNGLFLVGFAAETGDLIENMKDKMLRKNCSLMVGNLVNSSHGGFGSDNNEIVIMGRGNGQVDKLPRMTKRQAAEKIFDRIVEEIKQ